MDNENLVDTSENRLRLLTDRCAVSEISQTINSFSRFFLFPELTKKEENVK